MTEYIYRMDNSGKIYRAKAPTDTSIAQFVDFDGEWIPTEEDIPVMIRLVEKEIEKISDISKCYYEKYDKTNDYLGTLSGILNELLVEERGLNETD